MTPKRGDHKSQALNEGKRLLEQTQEEWFKHILKCATSSPPRMKSISDGDFGRFYSFYEELIIVHENLQKYDPVCLATLERYLLSIRSAIRRNKGRNQAAADRENRLKELEQLFGVYDRSPWISVVGGGLVQGK